MQAKIILNQPLTQERYGLHFEHGEALCNNEYIITKLQKKGVKVEIIEEETKKTIDKMTIDELKKYASENNIEIPVDIVKKNDILEFIKNYKVDDENKEDSKNPENSETSENNEND